MSVASGHGAGARDQRACRRKALARLPSLPRSFTASRPPRRRRGLALAVVTLAMAAAGCEPPPLTDNGVIGIFGGVGLGNGDFSYPRAVTAEPEGSVFIVDKSGRIQRFSARGEFETGWKMPLSETGKPVGIAIHPDGRLFVADTHYHRVMIFDRDGHLLGQFGEQGDGDGQMQLPTDVDFDNHGFIYVSEYQGNDRLTKWAPDLTYVRAIGEAPIDGERLRRPAAIDVDGDDVIWVADACNHRIVRFDTDGRVLGTFGELGEGPGQLRYPYDINVAPDGASVMVCEYGGNRLQWFDRAGRSLRTWGGHGREPGRLWTPWGAAYGPGGNVYVVDSLNSRIQIVRP